MRVAPASFTLGSWDVEVQGSGFESCKRLAVSTPSSVQRGHGSVLTSREPHLTASAGSQECWWVPGTCPRASRVLSAWAEAASVE